ncbi:acyltransferase [Sphingobacterium multivorum]|uniref:acyltransferase n=1 Tax=Sphingobacterium multivorum TaxID=28454 RepID=UPI0031BAF07C
MKLLANLILTFRRILNRILMYVFKTSFKKCGKNVLFFPLKSDFNYKNISIGDDVFIGDRAYFYASLSNIYIGNKVMFGPNVTIRGGNHSTHIIGKYMFDYKNIDKLDSDDEDVHIEDDVWIGTNVTILKGVRIRQGTIIAAGSVVTKSTEEYAIYGGIPAKKLKYRFTEEELISHKSMLKIK